MKKVAKELARIRLDSLQGSAKEKALNISIPKTKFEERYRMKEREVRIAEDLVRNTGEVLSKLEKENPVKKVILCQQSNLLHDGIGINDIYSKVHADIE